MNTRLLIIALLLLPRASLQAQEPTETPQRQESQGAPQPAQTPPPARAIMPEPPAEADLLLIRQQLDRVLTDSGLPVGDEREKTAAQIDALAQRSNVISKQAQSPRAKLEASNLEARGYNALAQDAYLHIMHGLSPCLQQPLGRPAIPLRWNPWPCR